MSSAPRSIAIQDLQVADFDELRTFMQMTWTEAFGGDLTPSDLQAHLGSTLSDDSIRKYLKSDRFIVARESGFLVGFLQFGPWRTEPGAPTGDIEFRRLYVTSSHQRRGIGTRLLEAAMADETVAAANRVMISAWEENPGALRLYKKFGFNEVGRVPFIVDGRVLGHDRLLARPVDAPSRQPE